MLHKDFQLGATFYTRHEQAETGWAKWRVTDIGTRTIVAIRADLTHITRRDEQGRRTHHFYEEEQAVAQGLLNGPPYAVMERVFDEYSLFGCRPTPEDPE